MNKNYKIHYIEDPNQFLLDNMNQEYCSWDTETSSLKHFNNDFKVGCITMCFDGVNGYYLPFEKINKRILNRFFDRVKVSIGAGNKFDVKAMIVSGVSTARVDEDIILLYHMLNTSRKHNNLSALAWLIGFGGYDQELINYKKKNKIKNYLEIPEKILCKYATLDAIVTYKLYRNVMDNLVPFQQSVYDVYKNIVIPVYPVFIDMEVEGIKIDIDYLNKLDKKFLEKQNILEEKILKIIGKDININSDEQLAKELERMRLPEYGRTEKELYRTGEKVLSLWVKDGYEIADLILQHRQVVKLRTGFIGKKEEKKEEDENIFVIKEKENDKDVGIVKNLHDDGKVHPSYGIAMTEPARQFCSNFNIQQYPGDENLRKIFDFGDDYLFGEFDVSGFHLRLMACQSEDENMRDVFINQSGDLHSSTAITVFCRDKLLDEFIKLKNEEPYKTFRFRSKGINFAFIYLGNLWNIKPDIEKDWSEDEMDKYIKENNLIIHEKYGKSYTIAEDIFNKFMNKYEGIPIYVNKQIEKAKENGYIKTVYGNIRHLPEMLYIPREMSKKQKELYNHLESICSNTEILSIEAFMMHYAMTNIYNEFKKNNMKSKLIMMIHDSVGVKIHKNEVEDVKRICSYYLENFDNIDLKGIPIESECKAIGKYWGV